MDKNTKILLLALTTSLIAGLVVADSYLSIDDGFVFEGYQMMDENRDSVLEYNPISEELEPQADIDMQENQLNNFFQNPCSEGEVVSDVNSEGDFVCVGVAGESESDFVNRDGDSLNGSIDVSGYELQNIGVLTGEGNLLVDDDLEVQGSVDSDRVETDTVDMSGSNSMCIGDQCN